jgi:hypothetical protein
MAKTITILNGYAVRFDQRAKGEETPYYVGKILKDNKEVGYFSNGGRGGPTTIMPPAVADAFREMVAVEAKKQGKDSTAWIESEALMIEAADLHGYKRGMSAYKFDTEFFPHFMKLVIADRAKFGLDK